MSRREADTAARGRSAPDAAGQRYTHAMAALVRKLPFGLDAVVPPTVLGYAIINGFTFSVDLSLVTAFHGGLRWPLPLAFTVSYVTAFGLSFALNRILNFRSHGAVGRQLAWYVPVVVLNYAIWILGLGDGLSALGLDYRLSRIAAGICEAVYMYCAMRWVVFRRLARRTTSPASARSPTAVGTQATSPWPWTCSAGTRYK